MVPLCIYQFGTLAANGTFGIGTVFAILVAAGMLFMLIRPANGRVFGRKAVSRV